MEPLLNIHNLNYSYHSKDGETHALKNISLTVNKGEFVSIVGPSGCGKSTLLSLIAGLLKSKDSIEFERNLNIGYMLQKDHLFEWRNVYKNIILGLEVQHKLTKKALDNVEKMLCSYGLSAFKKSKPSELSGGMRQRAALIRTLALEPELLLLDEPFSALDYQTRLEVADDIGKIIKKEHKTAILVTHDLSEAIAMGDRVYVMSHRPATIKKSIDIKLTIQNNEERTPMNSRNAPEFKNYFNMIWEELTHEHG